MTARSTQHTEAAQRRKQRRLNSIRLLGGKDAFEARRKANRERKQRIEDQRRASGRRGIVEHLGRDDWPAPPTQDNQGDCQRIVALCGVSGLKPTKEEMAGAAQR